MKRRDIIKTVVPMSVAMIIAAPLSAGVTALVFDKSIWFAFLYPVALSIAFGCAFISLLLLYYHEEMQDTRKSHCKDCDKP